MPLGCPNYPESYRPSLNSTAQIHVEGPHWKTDPALIAAKRRRNSAQGERSGTLGHEPNVC